MSYENLASTKLLARQCCVCGRALRDAASAELGIGPDCREKHGYDVAVNENNRALANKLIFLVADKQRGIDVVEAVRQLRNLGFTVLAERIATRLFGILVTEENGVYRVKTPYTEAGVAAFKAIPAKYRTWDREEGVNVISGSYAQGWTYYALKRGFPGSHGIGPKGVFRLPGGFDENEVAEAA